MDWSVLPYSHKNWCPKFKSIFAPLKKVTFPQFIVEMLMWNRSNILKDFPKLEMGEGWSKPVQKQIRLAIQQAYVLLNYFPHPDEDPLVEVVFRNVFRQNRVLSLGQYRKVRVKKDGSSNITQEEKDLVKALQYEFDRLLKQRNIFKQQVTTREMEAKDPKDVKFQTKTSSSKRKSLDDLMALEKKLNG